MQEVNSRQSTPEQKEKAIEEEKLKLAKAKEEAEKSLEDFKSNIDKFSEEAESLLELEMDYFTPLVHHLIQTHIKKYGKSN